MVSLYSRYIVMQVFLGFPLVLLLMVAGFALTWGLEMVS